VGIGWEGVGQDQEAVDDLSRVLQKLGRGIQKVAGASGAKPDSPESSVPPGSEQASEADKGPGDSQDRVVEQSIAKLKEKVQSKKRAPLYDFSARTETKYAGVSW